MHKLEGKIQHYAWGGKVFIPALLDISNTDDRSCAEYWMGAHPAAPSTIFIEGKNEDLATLIKNAKEKYLGSQVLKHFSSLPYLLKILDVRDMLSIQVHPSKEEAIKGFEKENRSGIPLDAPNRNYKDANHKPEMMLALSDFWLLHGFKVKEKLIETFSKVPEFKPLLTLFNDKGYRDLYQHIMQLSQQKVDEILSPLAARIKPMYDLGKVLKSSPDFWAARAMKTYPDRFDRGIFSIYLFNLVNLKKGEAIFQGAGLPHAYLEGQNVELMSNSDNVLRGGLTPKHVDVAELMKHTRFEPITPQKMKPVILGKEKHFICPVPDFGLSWIELSNGENYTSHTTGPEIVFVLAGKGNIGGISAEKGEAFFLGPKEELNAEGTLSFVRAFVPLERA